MLPGAAAAQRAAEANASSVTLSTEAEHRLVMIGVHEMCLGLNGQDAATVQLMTASGDDSSYVHLYVIAVQETCFMACRIVMQVCKR